jgi:hypothetical protein
MRARDQAEATRIDAALTSFQMTTRALPGIQTPACRTAFLEQLFESIHRVRYIARILARDICDQRANPGSDLFDPIKGAALRARQGQHDEACWLVFLSVHFGKHLRSGWRYCRDVYGGLGGEVRWDWARTSADPEGFRRWLAASQRALRNDGTARGFGNHRKYQSIDANSPTGTGAAVVSYVNWVRLHSNHSGLVQDAVKVVGNDRRRLFDYLYLSMNSVASFGRTARFDYLTMLGKLDLAPIQPGSAYLSGATGPLRGARLLFLGDPMATGARTSQLQAWVVELATALEVGMQELEDSLCNWQKSSDRFIPFRG